MNMQQPLMNRRDYDSYPKVVEEKIEEQVPDPQEKLLPIDYDQLKVTPDLSKTEPMTCPYCGGHKPFDPMALKRASVIICPLCARGVPTSTITKTASGYESMLFREADRVNFEEWKRQQENPATETKEVKGPRNPLNRNHETNNKIRLILNVLNNQPGGIIQEYKVPVIGLLNEIADRGDYFKDQQDFGELKKNLRNILFNLNFKNENLAKFISMFVDPKNTYKDMKSFADKELSKQKSDTSGVEKLKGIKDKVYEKTVENITELNKSKTKKAIKVLEKLKDNVSQGMYKRLKEDNRLEGMKFASTLKRIIETLKVGDE